MLATNDAATQRAHLSQHSTEIHTYDEGQAVRCITDPETGDLVAIVFQFSSGQHKYLPACSMVKEHFLGVKSVATKLKCHPVCKAEVSPQSTDGSKA